MLILLGQNARFTFSVSYIEIIRFPNNIACDGDEAQNLVLINFEYSFLNDVIKENAKNEK